MRPELDRNFWIKEVGPCFEVTSNSFYGTCGAIEYLVTEGYEINYNAIKTIGGMFLISTVGKEKKSLKEKRSEINQLMIDKESLEGELQEKTQEIRILKSQVTRLKNKETKKTKKKK